METSFFCNSVQSQLGVMHSNIQRNIYTEQVRKTTDSIIKLTLKYEI